MTVRYEANPPKILPDVDPEESLQRFVGRVQSIAGHCDAIHLTANVLGNKRVSPVEAGMRIRDNIPDLPITVSLRVRDMRDSADIERFVDDCIAAKFSGILVLRGDPPRDGRDDPGRVPSEVVRMLRGRGLDSKIDLYLSTPGRPDFGKIQKKIDAMPRGFVTQVVRSPDHVRRLVAGLKSRGNFTVIPIVLYPSAKNAASARFLGLDTGTYAKNFEGFVDDIHGITGDVMITSPSDFAGLEGFLAGRRRARAIR